MTRDDHAVETHTADAHVGKAWETPKVTRFAAGQAENGPGGADDGLADS